jgi:hypothetical protein
MRSVAYGLQIVGACALSAGGFFLATWIGCAVFGLCCVLFGVALERD